MSTHQGAHQVIGERHVSFDMIVHAVCAVSGRSRVEIMRDGRTHPETVRLRQTAWWLATRLSTLSYAALGRASGLRDHTTVLKGVACVERLRTESEIFRAETDALLGTLTALQRDGMLRMAAIPDPVAAARRVLAAPEREAVRLPLVEILALCRLVVGLFGESDDLPEPTDPATPQEKPHVEIENQDARREPARAADA